MTTPGRTCSTTTAPNGSFALDVHHGQFGWRVSKQGYRAISGGSSVGPMNTTVLDLSDKPLMEDTGAGPSRTILLVAMVVLVVVIAGVTLILLKRRGSEGPKG